MKHRLKTAIKLTVKLEQQLGVSFGVSYFREAAFGLDQLDLFKFRGWYEPWNVIQLPNSRGVVFREFLYHELGHALMSEYSISKSLMKLFTTRAPSYLKYLREVGEFSNGPRPLGFISRYATINRSEDFCETFSAWVLNDFKTQGIIRYNGDRINLNADSKLRLKFEAMKQIIRACADAERLAS